MMVIGCFMLVLVLLVILTETSDLSGFDTFCDLEYRNYLGKINIRAVERVSQYYFLLLNSRPTQRTKEKPIEKRCERMKVTIREAVKTDLPQIMALLAQLSEINISLNQAEDILKRIGNYPFFKVYVALLKEQVVGVFELLVMDNLAHSGKPSAIIEDVVVAEEFREKGIGKAMMEMAMNICREKGCYKVALSSNLKRESAHRFYESLGFQKHGFSFYVKM